MHGINRDQQHIREDGKDCHVGIGINNKRNVLSETVPPLLDRGVVRRDLTVDMIFLFDIKKRKERAQNEHGSACEFDNVNAASESKKGGGKPRVQN